MKKPTYTQLAETLSTLIGAFSDVDALLDNYMSQCDATKAESKTSKAANRVHAKAITICAAALTPEPVKPTSKASLKRAAQVLAGKHPDIDYDDVRACYGLDPSFVWTPPTFAPYVDQYLKPGQ
jgi:hypothetical protein